jgi:hypothetical protein
VAYEPLVPAFLADISTTSEARASSQHHIRKVEDKNMPREFADHILPQRGNASIRTEHYVFLQFFVLAPLGQHEAFQARDQ